MRSRLLIFLVISAAVWTSAGATTLDTRTGEHVFEALIKIDHSVLNEGTLESYRADFESSLNKHKSRQGKRDQSIKSLEQLFYSTHRKYLKKYVPFQSFSKLMDDGTYGCLTATALYALFLEELGYSYKIIETNYHIFIVGEVNGQKFLIESTDPINGFLDTDRDIEDRLNEVVMKNAEPSKSDRHRFTFEINRSISLKEMIGLQYYNLATQDYNEGNLLEALANLDKANRYYQSERIDEFLVLVIDRIAKDRNLLIQLNLNKSQYQILAKL